MEDPLAANGNAVHWYVPFIQIKNNKIINYIEGFNTTIDPGRKWVGPCPPPNTGWHNYIWSLYSLDKMLIPNTNDLHIISSNNFEQILRNNNIKIINKIQKNFKIYVGKNFYNKFLK